MSDKPTVERICIGAWAIQPPTGGILAGDLAHGGALLIFGSKYEAQAALKLYPRYTLIRVDVHPAADD